MKRISLTLSEEFNDELFDILNPQFYKIITKIIKIEAMIRDQPLKSSELSYFW
jgi:hypothetical protein